MIFDFDTLTSLFDTLPSRVLYKLCLTTHYYTIVFVHQCFQWLKWIDQVISFIDIETVQPNFTALKVKICISHEAHWWITITWNFTWNVLCHLMCTGVYNTNNKTSFLVDREMLSIVVRTHFFTTKAYSLTRTTHTFTTTTTLLLSGFDTGGELARIYEPSN